MSIVWWGRRRLVALLLFWGHRSTAEITARNPGCAIFCPGGSSTACLEDGVCPLTYRCQWRWRGRLFGATVLVYDTDRSTVGPQGERRGHAQTISTGASERTFARSREGGIASR